MLDALFSGISLQRGFSRCRLMSGVLELHVALERAVVAQAEPALSLGQSLLRTGKRGGHELRFFRNGNDGFLALLLPAQHSERYVGAGRVGEATFFSDVDGDVLST